jgi:hypothetical protein
MEMRRVAALAAQNWAFFLCLLCVPITASALSGTFKGILIPPAVYDAPIPIVIEFEELAHGRFSGKLKTSPPMIGEGEVLAGERIGEKCDITSKIGEGVRLRLEGVCKYATFEGKYSLYREAERHQGMFKLNRDRAADAKKNQKKGPSDDDRRKQAVSMTMCIRSNTQCLALCPRGEYSAEFVCVNGCRRKLTSCKARAKNARILAPESFD